MKKRPWPLTLFALVHGLIALSIPVQIILLYGHHPLHEAMMIWHKISWLNLCVILLSLVNAVLFWRGSRYVLYLMPLSFMMMAVNNYFVSSLADDYTFKQTSFATLAYIFPHFLLLYHKSAQVFWEPTLRWWLCPKRYPFGLPVTVETSQGKRILSHTFDISETGAFLKINIEDLEAGEEINLEIPSASGPYMFKAQIVRKAAPKGHYPAGVGVKFSQLDLAHQLYLRKIFQQST